MDDQNQQENNNDMTGKMYCYNGGDSSSINEPPQEGNAIRRSLGEGENSYKNNNNINNVNNYEENVEQNAIRRSLGDKNPNSDYPNYAEKSSEQRIPNFQENQSPFEKSNRFSHLNPQIEHPPFREEKKYYLVNYLLIAALQIILIVVIGTAYQTGDGDPNKADDDVTDIKFSFYYHFFKDVHLMIFIGFGLLYTALKDHQWSSVGIVLFIGIFSFEVSFLWNFIWYNVFINSKKPNDNGENQENNNYKGWSRISLNFDQLIQIDYIAASALISLGALIGKTSITQLIIISIFEPFFSSLNYYLCYIELGAIDNGGSLYIHSFGAIFGIVAIIVLFCNSRENSKISKNPHLSSDYYSNIISFIGALFLWLYFPSFNIAKIQCKEDEDIREIMRYRGIVNTYLSMVGSVIGAFVVSPIVSSGKIKIEHLINGSYVGGIIIGGCCTICSSAWGAILIGFIGGCLNVIGFWGLKNILKERKLDDTFGILYTFGIPGILGGFLNSIFMGNFKNNSWRKKNFKEFFGFSGKRSPSSQGGIQIAAIFITIGFAGVAGIVIGFILKTIKCDRNELYFVDSEYFKEDDIIALPEWKIPRMVDQNLSSSGNKMVQEREVNIEQ